MQFSVPTFKLKLLSDKQDRLLSKIGGLPWGLPAKHWPRCCKRPMKLLAQLVHEPPHLDLGAPDRVLHLFVCFDCGSYDQNTGLLLNRSQLSNRLTCVRGADSADNFRHSPRVGEAWITGWRVDDDGIPASREHDFYDEKKLWAIHDEYAHIEFFKSEPRFGGHPRWTGNGPLCAPDPREYRFLFQIDGSIRFDGKAPHPDKVDMRRLDLTITRNNEQKFRWTEPTGQAPLDGSYCPYLTKVKGQNGFHLDAANLAGDGTVFVFIQRKTKSPKVLWHMIR